MYVSSYRESPFITDVVSSLYLPINFPKLCDTAYILTLVHPIVSLELSFVDQVLSDWV